MTEGCREGFFVIEYYSRSFPVKHDETVEIFFSYSTGVEKGLAVGIVARCEIFVEV